MPRGSGFTAENKNLQHVSSSNNIPIIKQNNSRAPGTFSSYNYRSVVCLCTVHSIYHHIRWQMPSEFRSLIDPMLKLQRFSSTNAGKRMCTRRQMAVCILNPICIIKKKEKKCRKAISNVTRPRQQKKIGIEQQQQPPTDCKKIQEQ